MSDSNAEEKEKNKSSISDMRDISGTRDDFHIKAMQEQCSRMLQLKIFRGYYLERRFVPEIKDYRDVIALHMTEAEMEKQLLAMGLHLQNFSQMTRKYWIGITNTKLDINQPRLSRHTFVWTELGTLPFGEYWFNIKSIKFRNEEIILRIKVVQPFNDSSLALPSILSAESTITARKNQLVKSNEGEGALRVTQAESQVTFQDFCDVLRNWGISCKNSIYDFMVNDISKENIIGFFQFAGILLLTIVSGLVVALKYLGVFTIRFLIELRHLLRVATPILLSIIDVIKKIIGGFYILIAMIWRDTVGKGPDPHQAPYFDPSKSIQYNRPQYKAIKSSYTHS